MRPTVATPSIIEARVANVIEPNDTQSISRPSWLEMSSIGSFAPSQPVTHIVGSRISDKVCFQSAEGSVQCASARFPMQSEPEVTIPLGARAQALVYGHGASELFVLTTDSRVLRANFSLSPPMFEPLPQFANARAVASSGSTACAVTQDHRVLCIHERSASAMPSEIPLPPTETIIAGQDDLCAIHTDGTVSCWGNSAHFRFPDFNRRDAIVRRNVPRRVEGLRDVRTLDLDARYAACAVHTDGRVSCWGDDDVTFPDDGSPIHWSPPTVVPGVDHARSVHVLRGQACAVREDGRALCWGARSGTRERLGPIPASDRALLVPLP